MDANWYFARDGQRFGPFTFLQFRQMAASGLLTPADMLWNDKARQWVSAGAVNGLFPNATPPPAAPPIVAEMVEGPPPIPVAQLAPAPGHADRPPSRPRRPPREDQGEPAGRPTPLRRAVDAVMATAMLLSIPFFCLNEFIGRPFLILAGVIWVVTAARAVVTGTAPSFTGRVDRRPVLYRLAGVLIGLLGLGMLVVGVVETARSLAPQGPQPNTPALAPQPPAARYAQLSFGHDQDIRYRADLKPAAERLGQVLKEIGYFDGRGEKGVLLYQRDRTWVVTWFWTAAALRDPAKQGLVRAWVSVQLAARAFPDEPMELRLCDAAQRDCVTFPVDGAGRCPINPRDTVYYTGAVRPEAERLAAYLRDQVDDQEEHVYLLGRRPPGWAVTLLSLSTHDLTPETRRRLAADAKDCSRRVFDGAPVQFELYDADFQHKEVISSQDAR